MPIKAQSGQAYSYIYIYNRELEINFVNMLYVSFIYLFIF